MTAKPRASRRDDQDHGHEHGEPALWQWFDWAVIVALVVIVAIAAEWLVGFLVRERISAGAARYLRRQPAEAVEDETPAE